MHFYVVFLSLGQGKNRVQMLTHDTKKALVQTTAGQISVCRHLFQQGFQYVLLRELQSDRIEGEFSVYRQSTGANMYMLASDVLNAFKSRLTNMAAKLDALDLATGGSTSHVCKGVEYADAAAIEECIGDETLTEEEEMSCAYVAGWLELKCKDLDFDADEDLISGKQEEFITEVSRGGLTVPHVATVDIVKCGLRFLNRARTQVCCTMKFSNIIKTFSDYSSCEINSDIFYRKTANVLLHGLHNLEKDHQKNDKLYQTSTKKARMAE